jgi:hypothetical protein
MDAPAHDGRRRDVHSCPSDRPAFGTAVRLSAFALELGVDSGQRRTCSPHIPSTAHADEHRRAVSTGTASRPIPRPCSWGVMASAPSRTGARSHARTGHGRQPALQQHAPGGQHDNSSSDRGGRGHAAARTWRPARHIRQQRQGRTRPVMPPRPRHRADPRPSHASPTPPPAAAATTTRRSASTD